MNDTIHLPGWVFSIDKIRVRSVHRAQTLMEAVPIKRLCRESSRTHVYDSRNQWERALGVIEAEQITDDWVEILCAVEEELGRYGVTYVELAYDFRFNSPIKAVEMAKLLGRRFRKLYSRNDNIREIAGRDYWTALEGASWVFNAVVYSRSDKKTGQPVVRVEWRIKSARAIASKTDIVRLEDVLHFRPAEFFTKHFCLETVDYVEFGRWLKQRMTLRECRGLDMPDVESLGRRYCQRRGIRSAAQLRAHLRKLKRRSQQTIGRPNRQNRQLRELSPYKLNKFFKPVSITLVY